MAFHFLPRPSSVRTAFAILCLVGAVGFVGLRAGQGAAGSPQSSSAAVQKPDDTRFTVVTLVPPGELDEPMNFSVAKDGRVFINERRTGDIKMYDPVTKTTQRVATIPVNHRYTSADGQSREAEEGFVGFVLDPNFEQNHWAYILYADRDATKHVLARIEFRDEMVNNARQTRVVPNSYKMVLEYETQRQQCCHTGGGMTFDRAGNLYITVGNNTSNVGGSQTDERPGRAPWDDQRGSANTNDLRGKLLRIHPEPDGTYTIPAGNLFPPGTPGTRPEIYAMGLRNPWRPSVDSRTGFVYWGEVGPDAQVDDPNVGPRGYDELNQAKRPGFFGWPYFVGENQAYPIRDYANDRLLGPKDPARPTNLSRNNTGLRDLPAAQPAFIAYPYDASDKYPEVGSGGRCGVGGPVYHRADFAAEAPRPWPAYFEGKWLATDCSRAWILSIAMDADSNYQAMERFLPGYKPVEPMDMKFGPEGDLYLLDYGSTWFDKSDDSRLVRIEYTAGNRTPKAMAASDKTGGVSPLQVTLSAAGSKDYDGDPLTYAWTVQPTTGAGGVRRFNGMNPRVSFDRAGTFEATVVVTDSGGAKDSATATIIVGNEPPAIAVTVPSANKTFYTPNVPVAYSVDITDKEDGKPAPDQVALSIDYVPEGFNVEPLKLGHTRVDASTKFAVAKALILQSDCTLCHHPTARLRGPSMVELAAKYRPDASTLNTLAAKVRSGSTGTWGPEVMPAHPDVSPNNARTIVRYFLSAGDTTLTSAPLSGSYTIPASDVDSGRGSVLIQAAYTDKGAPQSMWQTAQSLVLLRSPRLDPALADVKTGVDVAGGRGQQTGVSPRANGYVAFTKIDLTGIKRLDVATGGGGGGRGAAPIGGTIEVRVGSATGELLGQGVFAPTPAGALVGRGGAAPGAAPAARGQGAAGPAGPAAQAQGGGGRGGRGGGAVATAAVLGFPPAVGPLAESEAAPIGRGGPPVGNQPGAVVGRGAGPAGTPAAGGAPPADAGGRGGGRGVGGAGGAGGGRGGAGGAAVPPVAIDLKPTTGLRDVYIVFKNERATPTQALMTVSTVTFVQ